MIFLCILLMPAIRARIWSLDPVTSATYATQTSGQYTCVRVDATVTIDMTTDACNGFQCPRCFLYPPNLSTNIVLTISNCHALTAYPNSLSGPYATVAEQAIEYVFLYLKGTGTNQMTVADPSGYSVILKRGGGGNYIRKVYCINGALFGV